MSAKELIDAGAIGVLVILVIVFLRYIGKRDTEATRRESQWQNFLETRDKQWQDFIHTENESDTQVISGLRGVIERVSRELQNLRGDFDKHDEWERKAIEDIKTQSRKKRGTNDSE